MAQKINYQKVLDKNLQEIKEEGRKPKLLLQVCCAPCSSYCLEYLDEYFDICLLFYNPNIEEGEEYDKRAKELEKLIHKMPLKNPVELKIFPYDDEPFLEIAKGREDCPEGGERCYFCYKMRLEKAAQEAREEGFDYFCTSLSISPFKKSSWLNKIGGELEKTYGVPYLYSDFKKKNGYKRSIELSKIYGLYRQDYCGCKYSRLERERKENERSEEISTEIK